MKPLDPHEFKYYLSYEPLWHPGVQSQGSKTLVSKGGRTWMMESGGNPLRDWRDALRNRMALLVETEISDRPWMGCAVKPHLRIYITPPKSLVSTRKGSEGKLVPRAYPVPMQKPDVDKVERAIGDAGAGIWWKDDSHITGWNSTRVWGTETGILVWFEYLEANYIDGPSPVYIWRTAPIFRFKGPR